MKTRYFYILAAILLACACSEKEQDIKNDNTPQEGGKDAVHTELSAIIDNDADTRTAYTIDDVNKKARFAWAAGDGIDVMVNFNGVFTPVRFITQEAGSEVTFQDGTVAGDETLAGILAKDSGASLSNWAFYPSRSDEAANNAGYGIDWSIKQSGTDEILSVDIPSELTLPVSNPLSIVPLLGRFSGTSTYIFKPMMSVLAIPVTNLPATADFASISCDGAAISGYFRIDQTASAITQGDAVTAEHSLTLNYGGLSGDVTFYFPVPAGTIPAGLTLKVGTKADPESCMTITTKKALNMSQGKITVSPALAFAASDLQWTTYATGTFIDDFIWGQHSAFTSGTRVPVTIERSGLIPDRYRIANPYTTACAQFGYTPYTTGITADDYFCFSIVDGVLSYSDMRLGVEDKDSGGKPLKVSYRASKGANTYVVSSLPDGSPLELLFGAFYSDPDNSGYYYTRDDSSNQTIHLYIDNSAPETWTSLGIGRYMDEWMWKANGFAPYDVEVEVWRSSLNNNRYRITNPYPVANTAFYRTAASTSIPADEYMYLQVDPSTGYVTFGSLVTGMTRQSVTVEQTKNFAIADAPTWESIKAKGSAISASESKVIAGTNTAPEKIQLYSVYYDSADVTYFYTAGTLYKYLWFPGAYHAGETWSYYCDGTYADGLYDTKINNSVSSTIGTVAVTIEQSSVDANRFRVNNPYRSAVASSLLATTYDEYLYFTCGSTTVNNYVWFEPFRPGIIFDASPKELGIVHPVYLNQNYPSKASGTMQYSNVTRNAANAPTSVNLGPYYFDIATPNIGYNYPRHTGQYPAQTITITFGDAVDMAYVVPRQSPLILDFHNPVEVLTLPAGTLQKVVVKVTGVSDMSKVGLRLYDNGTGWKNSSYITPGTDGVVTFDTFTSAAVSATIDLNCWLTGLEIGSTVRFLVQEVVIDGVSLPIVQDTDLAHYCGIRVNHGGDVENVRGSSETVASFRIPALVTTNSGALIAAYDVRYANSGDLQGDIDVGMKRSTDGGKTWSSLQLIMDMGTYGSLPENQNGIGDPCLLVDENTGDIFCFAVWTHDHAAGSRALSWAGTGYEIAETPQLMMVRSSDDGLTWSAPVNVTRQVKKFDWRMTFQGPGRGITMKDGTLVIPFQHQIADGTLTSGIMYSTDHGLTWHVHNAAHPVTSEAAVAEIEPGVLLLTMRDETNSHARRNYYTTDLGRSWKAHASNGQLIEPTCEASLIHVDAADNSLGKDLLIFSNPHNTSGRSNMTIQISEDKGVTWPHSLLIDSGGSQYSCLTMVDNSTVGILYESSRGNILFQAIPLADIVK